MQKVGLWEDKHLNKSIVRLTKSKKIKENYRWKKRYYNWHHWNTKDHKNPLQRAVC